MERLTHRTTSTDERMLWGSSVESTELGHEYKEGGEREEATLGDGAAKGAKAATQAARRMRCYEGREIGR